MVVIGVTAENEDREKATVGLAQEHLRALGGQIQRAARREMMSRKSGGGNGW